MIWDDSLVIRKIIFGMSIATILILIDGFFLAYVRQFNLFSLLLAVSIEDFVLAIVVFKRRKQNAQKKHKIQFKFNWFILIVITLGSVLLLLFPSTNIYGGRDEGLYFMEGVHIAKTGRLDFETDQYLVENYEEISGWCELGYLGVYSKYYFGTSDSYGDHEFQFMPMLPVGLAIGYLLGGIPFLIRINGIIAILSLLVIYCFIEDYIGNKYHSLFSCVLILLSPAFLWNARGTFSEILAQFIMFVALYILCKAWTDYNITFGIMAGVLVGITSIVRIDAFVCGIGFLFAIIFMICCKPQKVKLFLCVVIPYATSVSLCILYSIQNVYSYVFEHRKLLIPLLVIQIILCGIFGTLCILVKKKDKVLIDASFLLDWRFQNAFIWAYWIFIIGLIFIRPEMGDTFATRAVREFSWYTSMIAVIYLPIGIKKILNNNKQHMIRLLPFLCISGSIYLLYICNPSISQDHIWCSRRWVFMSISFVMICFVLALGDFKRGFKRQYGYLLIVTVMGYLLCQDKPFLKVPMYKGLDYEYDKVAEMLHDGEVYFTDNAKLATTLRFVYDKPVYYMDIGHIILSGRSGDVFVELNNYMIRNDCQINFIGDANIFAETGITSEMIYEQTMCVTDLKRCVASFPRETYQLNVLANIYVLSPRAD